MESSKKERAPECMGLTESQWDAIQSIRPLEEMAVPTEEASRPVDVYLSRERFESEKRDLFDRVPVVATLSAYLPEPGSSLAVDSYGVPLLVSRDREGVARVFINACRHRGAKLVEGQEPVKTARISCPYHAWTYTAEGKLIGIPRQETFPSLNKCDLGLVELSSFEAGGFIWVGLNHKVPVEPLDGTDQICADLEALGLPEMYVYGRRSYDLETNWKFVIEPFLEGYHVQRLHAESIAKLFDDVPSVYSRIGHHQRQISGKANFDPAVLEGNIDNLHKYITHAYLAFPNTIVVTSPYYISVMVLCPRAENRTVVDYYMLVKGKPETEKAEELYSRSYKLIDEVFGGEDFRAALIQQQGLQAGGVDTVYFGGLEKMIGPFHDSVESFLKD
jgi:phenylpropionate dioxygenase-like ring-hydroxylating dioxygenase large terminal subunit